MASIVKRKYSGKKGDTVKYYITYRDIYGKQHTIGGYNGLQDAKNHLKDYEDGTFTKTDITIKNIFKLYEEKLKKKALSTYENYTIYYNKYFRQIEDLQYKRIDLVFLQSFFDEIEKHSKHVAYDCLKFAKAAANYAIDKNIISINKFTKVDKIELPIPKKEHLTIDELKQVLDKAENILSYQDFVCIYVFIGTGMREGEIFGLNVDDVDFNINGIRVNKQYTRGRLVLTPKTMSSNRIVYFHEGLAEILKKYIPTVKGNILFPNKIGGYKSADNFRRRIWTKVLKACGITKRVRLHDIRGSYIDMTLSSGLSVKFTQNNVGHARAETTTNIYARNNDDMINNAKEVINNIFCCRNVVEKSKPKKSNVLQFPKKPAISG